MKTIDALQNSGNRSSRRRGSILITLGLITLLAVLTKAQAVNPAPDGCYPNYTTAEGCSALQSLVGGAGNTAVGWYSQFSQVNGDYNTSLGAGALDLNRADGNTAVGAVALLLNTTGIANTATGTAAMLYNDSGNGNTANGFEALGSNITGNSNTAIGAFTLVSNIADDNTATGSDALFSNTTGNLNTAVGSSALYENMAGFSNTAVGSSALYNNDGSNNTAIGINALFNDTAGGGNTAIGGAALFNNSTGGGNVALGFAAGSNLTNGSHNVYIGADMNGVSGENDSCYIRSIFGQTSASGTQVFINSNNKLGSSTSSKRFKEDIKPMDKASEALFSLRPVTFRYKREIDLQGIPQFGLVAEDVEKVNPDLVVQDKEGKPYSVRYDQVNAMLLNEFLKEHRKVEELTKEFQTTVAQQQKQIEALTTGLQKVSAQLEATKPAPQMVNNP